MMTSSFSSRGGALLKAASFSYANANVVCQTSFFGFSFIVHHRLKLQRSSSFSTTRSSLEPPDISRLAKTAQISLTPKEVEEFGPKIQQVIDWFGQLQGVDLETIEPSIRTETENNLRENAPETFENRDALVASIPTFEEPFIKVPKVLSMD